MTLPTYGSVTVKQKVWKTAVPSKLQHFLWRVSTRSIATGSNLRRRHVTRDSICKRCWLEEESEDHLFFTCPYARQIWRASGLDNTTFISPTASFDAKLLACLTIPSVVSSSYQHELAIWVLWRIWKSQNLLLYQQRQTHWKTVLNNARIDAREWSNIAATQESLPTSNTATSRRRSQDGWRLLPQHWIKCNVDASFINSQVPANAGWVCRDDYGTYKGAVQTQGYKVSSVLESELQAILMAMQHCWQRGYRSLVIESDCQQAIHILNDKALHFASYNWKREIRWWMMKFHEISFSWVPRKANKVADVLARNRSSSLSSYYFHFYVPDIVNEDYVQVQV